MGEAHVGPAARLRNKEVTEAKAWVHGGGPRSTSKRHDRRSAHRLGAASVESCYLPIRRAQACSWIRTCQGCGGGGTSARAAAARPRAAGLHRRRGRRRMARRQRGRIQRRGRRRRVRRRRGRIRRDSIGSTTRGGRRRATRARAHPPRGNVVGVGGGSCGRSWGGHVGFNQAPRVLSSCLSPAHIQHLLNGPLSGLWARSACCDCCATLLPRGEFCQHVSDALSRTLVLGSLRTGSL